MSFEDFQRDPRLVQVMRPDSKFTRQTVERDLSTGEAVVVNHYRHIPGSLWAKRRPLT